MLQGHWRLIRHSERDTNCPWWLRDIARRQLPKSAPWRSSSNCQRWPGENKFAHSLPRMLSNLCRCGRSREIEFLKNALQQHIFFYTFLIVNHDGFSFMISPPCLVCCRIEYFYAFLELNFVNYVKNIYLHFKLLADIGPQQLFKAHVCRSTKEWSKGVSIVSQIYSKTRTG